MDLGMFFICPVTLKCKSDCANNLVGTEPHTQERQRDNGHSLNITHLQNMTHTHTFAKYDTKLDISNYEVPPNAI